MSADREMSIIRDSIDFKINALKQTWTGALQEMIDRGDLGDAIDSLTKLSEAIVKLIPNLKNLTPAIASVGSAIASIETKKVVTRLTGELTSLATTGEQVKKLAKIKSTFSTLGRMPGIRADGTIDKINITDFRTALQGLTTEQKAAALSASGLNAQQAQLVLTSQEGSLASTAYTDAMANQILAQAGLITSTITLEDSELKELTTKAGITATTDKQILSALGLAVAEGGELEVKEAVNLELLKELTERGLVTKANYAQILSILGVNTAETAQITITTVLTGAIARLWATISANPWIAIATAIAAVTAALILHNKKVKEARAEIAKTATGEWEEANKKYKENKETFEDLAETYSKLSKGVDSLGRNISLSTDEFDEYHDVANQLAELSPDLVKGWDEQGNAILRVKDNVESLTEAYNDEMIAANNAIISKGKETFEASKDELVNAGFYADSDMPYYIDAQKRFDAMRDILQKKDITLGDISSFRIETEDDHGNAVVSYYGLQKYLEESGIDVSNVAWTGENQGQDLVDILNNLSDADRSAIKGYLSEQESILDEALTGRRDLFKAYMQNALNKEYKDLDQDLKDILNGLGDTLSNSVLQSYNSVDDINTQVQEIASAFESLTPENQNKIEEYIGLVTSWNNDEIPYDEYLQKIKAFSDLLETIFPGDENEEIRRTFTILFDIPDEEELSRNSEVFVNRIGEQKNSVNGSMYGVPPDVQEKLKKQGTEVAGEWYNSLTKSEQEFVDNLSDEDLAKAVKFDSTEEFDEWLDDLQAQADAHKIDLTFSTEAVKTLDDMQSDFESLTTAYKASVKNRDSSDNITNFTASASDIQAVNDAFGGVTFDEKDASNVNAMSNALEKYNTTLLENKGDAIAAQEATDELATAYVDQSGILDNLTEENKEAYISYLKLNGITNAQEVVESRLSKQTKKTAENLKKLSTAIAQNRSALDKGAEAGETYKNAIKDITGEVGALLSVYNDAGTVIFNAKEFVDENFVKEHLDDIYAAVEGDIDAINRLRIAVARANAAKYMIHLDLPSEAVSAKLDDLMELVSQADAMDIEVGASIEDSEFIKSLNTMLESTNMTVDELNKVFESIGFQAEYVKTGTTEIEVPDIDLSKTNGAINSAEDYKKANTGNKKKVKVSNFALTVTRTSNKATGASVNNFSGSSYSDDNDSGSGSSDSDSSNSSESFDWIERAIDQLEKELDRLNEQVDNTYKNWTSRNEALLEEIEKTGDEIKMQADASKKYEELANEVNIPETYKIKVQAGEMDVEEIDEDTITEEIKEYYNNLLDQGIGDSEWLDKYKGAKLTDEDFAEMAGINEDDVTEAIRDYYKDQLSQGIGTAEMLEKYNTNTLTDSDYAEMLATYIQDYEDLYDKSVEATDKETELTKTVLDYHKQIFEDIQTQLDEIVDEIEGKADLINERMTRTEEMGYFTSTNYYDQLLALTQEENDARLNKIEQATQAMNEAVENGMEVYSEEWYEMYNNLLDMTKEYEEGITEEVKLQNEKRQQLWDRADWIEDRMNDVVDEAQFLQGLLSDEKLFEDDGQFTKYGVSNLALLSAQYQANTEEAERYHNQYEALQEDLKKDPGNKDLIERLETVKKGWQDATSAVKDNEKAMQEALKAAVDQYLSNLQEIIDKYKEALQSSKDLYDWQKNISDQTTNIANLEKQINAYANDDSEEARKTRQELQKQLEDAQQQLEESQWDHYISETGEMLDDMYDKLSEYLDEQTEDMHVVRQLMETYVTDHESEATQGLTAIEGIYNYTSDYFDHMSDGDANTPILTDIKTLLNNIYEGWKFVANPEENGTTNTAEYPSFEINHDESGKVSISRTNGNAPAGATNKKGEWQSDENGWWYQYDDGSYAKSEWKTIDDQKYYFDENGYMATSQYVDGKQIKPDGTVGDEGYEWKESEDGKWWYGSGSENYATGHVKINGEWHTFDDEGWWLGAYAKGTKSVSRTGMGITNEDGTELVWRTDSGALLTPLNQGDMVFTNEMSQRLWEIAKGNLPTSMAVATPSVAGSSRQNVTANNQISIELPNVKNYEEFKKAMKNDSEMEKFWQEITVGQMMGNNTLKKNKY